MLIAITLDFNEEGTGYSDYPYYAVRRHYSKIVADLGATPIFLPFEAFETNFDILDKVSGIIVPGGDDHVPTDMYNEKPEFDLSFSNFRSKYESTLIQECLKRDMPFLGICFGMQILNVALGGSLYQNINSQLNTDIEHLQEMKKDSTSHIVDIKENTKLHKIVGKTSIHVNSKHTQAVKKLGKDLIVSGVCPDDNLIEAIESTAHKFVVAVQWHPEVLASKNDDINIFKSFIDAAKNYSNH